MATFPTASLPHRNLERTGSQDLSVHLGGSCGDIFVNVSVPVPSPLQNHTDNNNISPTFSTTNPSVESLQQQISQLQREMEQQKEHDKAMLRDKSEECDWYKQENHHLKRQLQQQKEHFQKQYGELETQLQSTCECLTVQQQRCTELEKQLDMEGSKKRQLLAQMEEAIAHFKGESVTDHRLEETPACNWEIAERSVHVSNKILGTGAWGYVAEGIFHGQKVAVKCIHHSILSQFTTNHVEREISIMAKVRHPNLILFIGAVLTVQTGPLIITELLERTLRSAYQERLLHDKCKLPILKDVASALSYLHSLCPPIIHRDVSSANVLLEAIHDEKWKTKLADFGSANLVHLATTPGEGAIVYSPPEVRTNARMRQSPKVDVYSFGVLVCEVSLCQFPPSPEEFSAFLSDLRANQLGYLLACDCTKENEVERPTMKQVLGMIDEQLNTSEF